jgi:hypothetical protein
MVTVEPPLARFNRLGLRSTAIALATLAIFIVALLSEATPGPRQGKSPATLRQPTQAELDGLAGTLVRDWGRARKAEVVWTDLCYEQRTSLQSCAGALRRQVVVLQRLLVNVGAQRLAGSQLATIVDTRFVPSIAAALAAKRSALQELESGQIARFRRDDGDPAICIQPVNAAIRHADGTRGGEAFLSYPAERGRLC